MIYFMNLFKNIGNSQDLNCNLKWVWLSRPKLMAPKR